MSAIRRTESGRLARATTLTSYAVCATVLAGCGGGDPAAAIELNAVESVASPSLTRTVQMEGCVVTQSQLPLIAASVRARSIDGRLVSQAVSDHEGIFRLRVPVHETVHVSVADTDGDALVVLVGRTNVSVGACLQHRHD